MTSTRKKRRRSVGRLQSCTAIVLKHLRLSILLLVLAVSLGLAYYVYARRVYAVRFTLEIHTAAPDADRPVPPIPDNLPASLFQQLQSDAVLDQAAAELGLQGGLGVARKQYLDEYQVRKIGDRGFEISFLTRDKELAERWPHAIQTTLENLQFERRRLESDRRIEDWRSNLVKIRAHLSTEIIDQLAAVRKKQKEWAARAGYKQLSAIPSKLKQVQEQMDLFSRIVSELERPGLDYRTKREFLEQAIELSSVNSGEAKNGKAPTPTPPDEGDKARILELEQDLQDMHTLLDVRQRIYQPEHPDVVSIKKKITVAEKTLDQNLASLRQRFDQHRKQLREHENQLVEKLKKLEKLEDQANRFRAEENELSRQKEVLEKQISELERKIEQEEKRRAFQPFQIKLSQIRKISDRPIRPRLSTVIFWTAGLGILIAALAPFIVERLDHTVTVSEDTEELLEMPCMGIVARIADPDFDPEDPEEEPPIITETFRMLRTNLLTSTNREKPPQLIMITSSVPQEGKSTVAFNLACSFARLGERVLLADLDLRRGRLHYVFDQDLEPGLTDLLADPGRDRSRCFRETFQEGLTFLPGGQRIENVTEMLATQSFADLLSRCRQDYTRIIVDTPPALGLAETSGMLPLVDGVLHVIWSGYTPIQHVLAATDQLRRNKAEFLGFVLNQVDMHCPTNYFRYYYYSDYYYTSYSE